MNDFKKVTIPNEVYYSVKVGDSVYKERGKDSAFYYLSNGKIVIEDCNKYLREDYLKLKDKE